MPRIYADVQDHTVSWGAVDFVEGVAAVPVGTATGYWTGASYAIDDSKHHLTVFDRMTKSELQALLTDLEVAFVAGDTKQALVRKAETFVSSKLLTALTITSVAGTAVGDSLITITAGEIGDVGNTLAYRTGAAAYTPLFRDIPGAAWTVVTLPDDITPDTAGDATITVIEINAAGEIVALGSVALTVKAGE